ncbi:MAG: ABA4-like family protein [Pseudomonadota bacterium]
MSWDTGFLVINALVMPAWVLLILLPRAKITRAAVHSMLWPVLIGAIYTALLIGAIAFGQSHPDAGFSFGGVQALFDHPNGVLVGWSHYLVFDLFVGAWIARDAQRREIAHWKAIPCILGSYVFGPAGLLLYAILRLISGHGFSLEERE